MDPSTAAAIISGLPAPGQEFRKDQLTGSRQKSQIARRAAIDTLGVAVAVFENRPIPLVREISSPRARQLVSAAHSFRGTGGSPYRD